MNPEERQSPSSPALQADEERQSPFSPALQADPPPSPMPASAPPSFDPSRMIGIIKRKTLIKELAAAYHAECLAYCQELLELQKKLEEPLIDIKSPNELRKETIRPQKRKKKTR